MPLPQPEEDDDKEARGRVLVVGGEAATPGALILAAEASLRAGAGKVQIGSPQSVATAVAVAVPESLVFALAETKAGAIAPSATDDIIEHAKSAHAVLIGPGMIDEASITRLLEKVLPHLGRAALILDAAALACINDSPDLLHALGRRVILTPNRNEMAKMLGMSKAVIARDPSGVARQAADQLRAVVALKGRETFIVSPGAREVYCNRAGNVGLGTSGSGDVLCGLIAGLAARGATPLNAAIWGVRLHARAGDALAKSKGRVGFLARELAAEVPRIMYALGKK